MKLRERDKDIKRERERLAPTDTQADRQTDSLPVYNLMLGCCEGLPGCYVVASV